MFSKPRLEEKSNCVFITHEDTTRLWFYFVFSSLIFNELFNQIYDSHYLEWEKKLTTHKTNPKKRKRTNLEILHPQEIQLFSNMPRRQSMTVTTLVVVLIEETWQLIKSSKILHEIGVEFLTTKVSDISVNLWFFFCAGNATSPLLADKKLVYKPFQPSQLTVFQQAVTVYETHFFYHVALLGQKKLHVSLH